MPRKKKYDTRAERIQGITNLDLGLKIKEIEKLAKADGFKQRFKYLRQKSLEKKNIEYQIENGVDKKTAKKNARKSQKNLTEIVESQVIKIEIADVTESNSVDDILNEYNMNITEKHSRTYYYQQLRDIGADKNKGSSNVGIIVGRAYTGVMKRKHNSIVVERYNINKDLTTVLSKLVACCNMIYQPVERILLVHDFIQRFNQLYVEETDITFDKNNKPIETLFQKHERLKEELQKNLPRFIF